MNDYKKTKRDKIVTLRIERSDYAALKKSNINISALCRDAIKIFLTKKSIKQKEDQ